MFQTDSTRHRADEDAIIGLARAWHQASLTPYFLRILPFPQTPHIYFAAASDDLLIFLPRRTVGRAYEVGVFYLGK